jgi:hypothetical protein
MLMALALTTARATTIEPSPLATIGVHAAGVAGILFTVLVLGFGLVTFGRPNLEIVSDTVTHSFLRAATVGVLGQLLVLPSFGVVAIALALTVAGVLVIPFALTVFALLVLLTGLIGALGVAHAIGEWIARRQMARGLAVSANSYRYVLTGSTAIALVWAGWVLFGWVPIAGTVMLVVAGVATWSLATIGLGAALLSRGGIREQFAGRMLASDSMTDEYLWATPQFGVPAVKRPGPNTPSS